MNFFFRLITFSWLDLNANLTNWQQSLSLSLFWSLVSLFMCLQRTKVHLPNWNWPFFMHYMNIEINFSCSLLTWQWTVNGEYKHWTCDYIGQSEIEKKNFSWVWYYACNVLFIYFPWWMCILSGDIRNPNQPTNQCPFQFENLSSIILSAYLMEQKEKKTYTSSGQQSTKRWLVDFFYELHYAFFVLDIASYQTLNKMSSDECILHMYADSIPTVSCLNLEMWNTFLV